MTRHYIVHHRLVGYDRTSDRPVYSLEIPRAKVGQLKYLIQFGRDDPEGYDSYELSYSQVVDLMGSLHVPDPPPRELQYFVEPFDPEERARRHHLPHSRRRSG
jgi:hypothetical protein